MTVDRHVDLTVISGLSGAGRSEAAKALEDLGWYVIDNLPPQLIEKMMSLALAPSTLITRIALVIDSRGGIFFEEADKALEALKEQVDYRMVFLEASDDCLVRRFDATRRRHPLESDDVMAGIQRERELMGSFRDQADLIIDTTQLTSRDLRMKMSGYFGGDDTGEAMKTTIVSFGYKYGLPLDADMVLDVRFLPNPHWIDELRPKSGLDDQVAEYVLAQPVAKPFLVELERMLTMLMPAYVREGKSFLSIAFGCTGGHHRSVVIAEQVAAMLRRMGYDPTVSHRDIAN